MQPTIKRGSGGSSRGKERPRLAPEKGAEVKGLLLAVVGVLLGLALLTYHPADPSILHGVAEPSVATRNLAGPAGAHVSAVLFAFLGLTAVLLPFLLLAAAWRALRRRPGVRVVGRGLGALLLLVSLPALLYLSLGDVSWRGEPMAAGGAFGEILARPLAGYFGFAGALFVFLGGVAVGAALLVQTTLGEVLATWGGRLGRLWQGLSLGFSRQRERRAKDRSRRRVVDKQLQRVARERVPAVVGSVVEEPLRVHAKTGRGRFWIRKVRAAKGGGEPGRAQPDEIAATRRPSPPAPPAASPAAPQTSLPFAGRPAVAELPPVNLLQLDPVVSQVRENELMQLGEVIRSRCAEFGVEGTIEGISPGPVITVFEFQPAPGVKVSQIVNLQDDLALALRAESVRIDRIPGRSTLGIEVPNEERGLIHLGSLLGQAAFQRSPSLLTLAIGLTIRGEPYYADLATMPHLLVAGATGSGKSVGLQSMITSMLYKARREEVQFIFIDPKRIELGVYADIPHLKSEVVVEPKKAANALRWAVAEMERRYRLLAEVHARSIDQYNSAIRDPKVRERLALSEADERRDTADLSPLPYYVVVIDELADLMMVAAADVETSIARLAQMARAVGIHLIVATQRPSVDVLTGTIKANFPCRMAFATATRHDSRTILDQVGSEKLLGKGDMLFMPPGTSRIQRLHGAYISEQETAALVRWLKKQGKPELDPRVLEAPEDSHTAGDGGDADDALFDEAARLVVTERQASASFLQRRLRVGFSRAARLIDMMERDGLLGPPQGSKPREVLVRPDYFTELDAERRSTEG